jgi:predicted PurR-regulated permease PerM
MAIASMVLGIIGLSGIPFVTAILALVFGYLSRNSIDRSEGRETGRAMSVTGIVLGYVGLVTSVGMIFFYVWWFRQFPDFLKNLPTPSP